MIFMETTKSPFLVLPSPLYDALKWVAIILLPSSATAYMGLGQVWELYEPAKVVATIAVVSTFLGVILGISNVQYNKSDNQYDGDMVVEDGDDRTLYRLVMKDDVENLGDKKSVSFKVVNS